MAREDEIKLIAYNIWVEEGYCDGHDLDHWVKAEIIWEEQKSAPAGTMAVTEKPAVTKPEPTPEKKKSGTKHQARRKNAVKQTENPGPKSDENNATV